MGMRTGDWETIFWTETSWGQLNSKTKTMICTTTTQLIWEKHGRNTIRKIAQLTISMCDVHTEFSHRSKKNCWYSTKQQQKKITKNFLQHYHFSPVYGSPHFGFWLLGTISYSTLCMRSPFSSVISFCCCCCFWISAVITICFKQFRPNEEHSALAHVQIKCKLAHT